MTPPEKYNRKADEFKDYIPDEIRQDREDLRSYLHDRFHIYDDRPSMEEFVERLYIPPAQAPPIEERRVTIELEGLGRDEGEIVRTEVPYYTSKIERRTVTALPRFAGTTFRNVGREQIRTYEVIVYRDSKGRIITQKKLRR